MPKDTTETAMIDDINFHRFAEPTYIVAFGTIFFYLIVSEYYISFFEKLSISFYTLDLPFTFFLYAGHWIAYSLLILFLFIITASVIIKENEVVELKNQFKLFFVFSFILLIITRSVILSVMTALFVISIVSFYNILIIYRKLEPLQRDKYYKYIYTRIMLTCIMILVFTLVLPHYLGSNSADNLIREAESNQEINVEFKENTDLSNKTLLLITQSGSNYYFVGKNQNIPRANELYIIPSDQIKRISIKNKERKINTINNYLLKSNYLRHFNFILNCFKII